MTPADYIRDLTKKTANGSIKWMYQEELSILEAIIDYERLVLVKSKTGTFWVGGGTPTSMSINRIPKIILPVGVLWEPMNQLFLLALKMSQPHVPRIETRYKRVIK